MTKCLLTVLEMMARKKQILWQNSLGCAHRSRPHGSSWRWRRKRWAAPCWSPAPGQTALCSGKDPAARPPPSSHPRPPAWSALPGDCGEANEQAHHLIEIQLPRDNIIEVGHEGLDSLDGRVLVCLIHKSTIPGSAFLLFVWRKNVDRVHRPLLIESEVLLCKCWQGPRVQFLNHPNGFFQHAEPNWRLAGNAPVAIYLREDLNGGYGGYAQWHFHSEALDWIAQVQYSAQHLLQVLLTEICI